MRVELQFPGRMYSKYKAKITKLRKDVGCTLWTGTSWDGDDFFIETAFKKQAEMIGVLHDYNGDILWLNGAEEMCIPFMELTKSIGGKSIVHESKNIGINWDALADIDKIIDLFKDRAKTRGMNEVFIKKWSKKIAENAAKGGPIVL